MKMKLGIFKLEIIASIVWFLMDMMWMWGFTEVAIFGFPIVFIALFRMIDTSKDKKVQHITTICLNWLTMNGLWMVSELAENHHNVSYFKIIATLFGAYGVLLLIIVFFNKNGK